MVPTGAARETRIAVARLLRLVRHDTKYAGTRVIFVDTERSNWTWDPVAGAYYWHRFYSHQPDLNFDNPHVLKDMLGVMRFWLHLGVDGLRLDAVPYLVEREGTQQRESSGDPCSPQAFSRRTRRPFSGPHVARRGQSMAGRLPRTISATATNAIWRFIFH